MGKFYYLRVAIPRNLSKIIGRKEIKYSLKTTCYQEALAKLRLKTAEIDWTIQTIRDQESVSLYERLANMKVITLSGVKFLEIDEKESDKLILERIENLQNFIKNINSLQKCKSTDDKEYIKNSIENTFNKIYLHNDWNEYYNFIKKKLYEMVKVEQRRLYSIPYTQRVYIPRNLNNIFMDLQTDNIYLAGIKPLLTKEIPMFEDIFSNNNNTFTPIEKLENITEPRAYNIQDNLLNKFLTIDNEILKLYNEYYNNNINIDTYKTNIKLIQYIDVYNILNKKDYQERIKNIVSNVKSNCDLEVKYVVWQDLFNDFWNAKRNQQPNIEKERHDVYFRAIKTFFDLLNQYDITKITKQDCLKYMEDYVYRIPKNYTKIKGYKDKLTPALLLSSTDTLNRMSKKTVVGYISPIREFMNYAYEHDVIKENFSSIFKSPRITKKEKEGKRDEFSIVDLKIILSNLPNANLDTELFFIPLISLFSGARLGEICQLTVNDICKNKDVYYMDINENDVKKSIKNEQSKRKVPIHQTLINLGFLDYVNYRKKDLKTSRVFPKLTYTEHSGWGGGFSKRFSRYLKRIDITGGENGKKTFHSFRHTFTTNLQEQKVSVEMRHQICGWEKQSVGEAVYGNHIKISLINAELQKVNYTGLNQTINNLKPWVDDTKKRK